MQDLNLNNELLNPEKNGFGKNRQSERVTSVNI